MINDEIELYVQLIMKKLVLETGGEISHKAYCDPFKMRVHLQGILGRQYSSETYHNAIDYIEREGMARYGGMYLTEAGAAYVEFLMVRQQRHITMSSIVSKRHRPLLANVV